MNKKQKNIKDRHAKLDKVFSRAKRDLLDMFFISFTEGCHKCFCDSDHGSLAGVMEALGYITSRTSPFGRKFSIKLTPAGRKMLIAYEATLP